MKYTCKKCGKELEYTIKTYGGYATTEGKNLCPECWEEYIEIKNRQHQKLTIWWQNEQLY